MKSWVGRLPIAGPHLRTAYRAARAAAERPKAAAVLAEVEHPHAPRLAQVVDQLYQNAEPDSERVRAIEKERAALLQRHEPLIDGSLGAPGVADAGSSVSEACRVSKSPRAARLLYWLGRAFAPQRGIELGTNLGLSSAYQAAAFEEAGAQGRLVTLESSPYRLRIAREVHARIGLANVDYRQGRFVESLDAAIEERGPFDFAFIDGHHAHEPTLDYFERIWRNAHDDALFVFDDIRWSTGMEKAWADVCRDERVAIALDLDRVGVCVVRRQASDERWVLPPLRFALG
ncbi:MAG: class I SAM-dependent methyltransferase [Myxococcota bacterium]